MLDSQNANYIFIFPICYVRAMHAGYGVESIPTVHMEIAASGHRNDAISKPGVESFTMVLETQDNLNTYYVIVSNHKTLTPG